MCACVRAYMCVRVYVCVMRVCVGVPEDCPDNLQGGKPVFDLASSARRRRAPVPQDPNFLIAGCFVPTNRGVNG